mmetsp:Transcript_18530/g.56429  ORF Transcript_18530/g.56429 Transcript_18530/m.56429 type:complete len:255 (-) Transcript_18530:271-1035(-)
MPAQQQKSMHLFSEAATDTLARVSSMAETAASRRGAEHGERPDAAAQNALVALAFSLPNRALCRRTEDTHPRPTLRFWSCFGGVAPTPVWLRLPLRHLLSHLQVAQEQHEALEQKLADITASRCPTSIAVHWPLSTFQTRVVLSPLDVATSWPSGEKQADVTTSSWPESTSLHSASLTSQILAMPSAAAVTRSRECGEKTADWTELQFPLSVSTHSPVAALQHITRWSADAVATSVPSGEKLAHLTSPSWPVRV